MSLRDKAAWVWRETVRVHTRAPDTRLASSLSSVEIFTALYYGGILRFNPQDPRDDSRDRCVISKGHGSICMYPILADLGFYDMSELERVCQPGSFLGGIPDPVIPGYETVNGSLGHGLGVASGMALSLKRRGRDERVVVVCGDGELHEGACWEAIMFAGHHRLNNMTMIVDNNNICMLGYTKNVLSQADLSVRLGTFGWDVYRVDGHDVDALVRVLKETTGGERPRAIIADTVKGRGVPSIENRELCHVIDAKKSELEEILRG